MENQLSPIIASSQDSSQIANKIKGAILAVSSLLIMGAALVFHITLSANDIITLSTEIGTIAGAVWAIYGCILHLVTWFGTIKQ